MQGENNILIVIVMMIRLNILILNLKFLNSNYKFVKRRQNFSSGKSDEILARGRKFSPKKIFYWRTYVSICVEY